MRRPDSSQRGNPDDRLRIAVIEDSSDFRELLTLLLRTLGHEVTGAPDGRSGLALLCDIQPDAAFVDIDLPFLDGHAVARMARRRGVRTHLVAMSGFGQVEDRAGALDSGFDDYLVKPATLDDLCTALAAVARRRDDVRAIS